MSKTQKKQKLTENNQNTVRKKKKNRNEQTCNWIIRSRKKNETEAILEEIIFLTPILIKDINSKIQKAKGIKRSIKRKPCPGQINEHQDLMESPKQPENRRHSFTEIALRHLFDCFNNRPMEAKRQYNNIFKIVKKSADL